MTMQIHENFPLKNFNTFGIDVTARFFCTVLSDDELRRLLEDRSGASKFVLGGGSNILFTGNVDALVIQNRIPGMTIIKDDGVEVLVEFGAGEIWHDVVKWAVDNSFGGIENLSLIPGCVGAAPIQNIGAYGAELKDVFISLNAIDLKTGESFTFDHAACGFGYRQSVFKSAQKDRFAITTVRLKLSRNAKVNTSYGAIEQELEKLQISSPGYKDVSTAVCNIRRSKLPDPSVIGNAGSFFKNPVISRFQLEKISVEHKNIPSYPAKNNKVKIAAGWLIESCGWKGKVVGNTGTHTNQALVIVNHGNATGKEIYDLSEEILNSVNEKFGIVLEREVNVL